MNDQAQQDDSPYGKVNTTNVFAFKGFLEANKIRQEYSTHLLSEMADNMRKGAAAAKTRDAQKITLYKESGEKLLKESQENAAVFMNPDPKKWEKADWTNIALGAKSGPEGFKPILDLYNAALKTDANDNYTPDAIKARQALLQEFTPFSKQALQKIEDIKAQFKAKKLTQKEAYSQIGDVNSGELDKFMHTIYEVAVETKPMRDLQNGKQTINAGFKNGALFDADKDIKLNPLDNKSFDQQAALAMLESKGVKVDSDQSLKTPKFEEAALAAVKNLKAQSIAIAA